MNTLPFLCAAFLLINPVLLALFRRLVIPLEKLQFWVMVSTGTAWIIAGALVLLDPESQFSLALRTSEDFLPGLAFSLDQISTILAFAVCGLLFYLTLTRQDAPRQNALLAGMSGVAVLGLYADSAYTLALAWTGMELFNYGFLFPTKRPVNLPGSYYFVVLGRFLAPLVLIALSLSGDLSNGSGLVRDWSPAAGPYLTLAGLVGFSGWFIARSVQGDGQAGNPPGWLWSWIPGSVGLMMALRGGGLVPGGTQSFGLPLALSILAVLISVGGLLLDFSSSLWFLGAGLLAAGSSLLGFGASGLSWAVIFMLPGALLWLQKDQPRRSPLPLGLAGVGLLPLPYLPAWSGSPAFQRGITGILLACGAGFFLGSLLIAALKNLSREEHEKEDHSLLPLIGSAMVLLSQLLIAYRLGLLPASTGLLAQPIFIWLPLLVMALVAILGNWLPLQGRETPQRLLSQTAAWLGNMIRSVLRAAERLVLFISAILEGEGGLIWALLIGFLIITLLSTRGGP